MASSAAKHVVSLFFLLTILSSLHTPTHARDSQFFNKLPSSTTSNNNIVPDKEQPLNNQQEDQEPSFQPENENGYGLDGQESSRELPSSATTTTTIPLNAESKQPLNKYLPKNYNPVAYVTEPEDTSDTSTTFTEEKSYPNKDNYYYNSQQEEEYRNYPTTTTTTTTNDRNNNYNNYYNGGESFNTDPQGMSDTRFMGSAATNSREKHFNNGGEINSYQPQGMSDTRFFENGKYFYDVNSEKYSSNHPYTSLRGVRTRNAYNNRNYYGNNENAYEFNGEDSINGRYQNQDEFQDEVDNNMP